jgi:hypothetical protein
LPLPAPPTEILACPPKTLENLAEVTAPRVQDRSPWLSPALFVLALGAIALALSLTRMELRRRDVVLVCAALGVLAFMFFTPSLMSVRLRLGVEVLSSTPAGVYDVRVIRGDTSAAVAAWLDSNGFAVSADVRPVLDDYVKKQWCFAVATVRAEKAADFAHHPVRFTFPSSQAVYPLRLTGVRQGPLALELFVIGAERAAVRGLDTWVSGIFRPEIREQFDDRYVYTHPPVLHGSYPTHHIGLERVSDLMWTRCVVTRLRGVLPPERLGEDVQVEWLPSEPYIRTLQTRRSVIETSLAFGSGILGLGWLITAGAVGSFGWKSRQAARYGLIPSVLLAALATGGGLYFQDSVATSGRDTWRSMYVAAQFHEDLLDELSQNPPQAPFPEAYSAMVEAQIKRRFEPHLEAEADLLTLVRNYSIEAAENGWKLTFEGHFHIPITVAIDPDGRPRTRPWNTPAG